MPVKKTKSTTAKSKPAPARDEVTTKIISFIDEAAGLLKQGVRQTSDQTESARKAARKKALTLLGKASTHLNDAIEQGASALRKEIRKL